jgi:hypothetical protein
MPFFPLKIILEISLKNITRATTIRNAWVKINGLVKKQRTGIRIEIRIRKCKIINRVGSHTKKGRS